MFSEVVDQEYYISTVISKNNKNSVIVNEVDHREYRKKIEGDSYCKGVLMSVTVGEQMREKLPWKNWIKLYF